MNIPKTAKKSKPTVGETVEDVIQKIKIEKDIRLIPIEKIEVYERNAKKHTPWQVGAVAKAIQTFGFNVPLVLDGKNVIIAGHCRLESAKSLGMNMVPCIIKTDLTPSQVQAYRLLDNKLNESMWDRALAMEDVKEMGSDAVELLKIGYDDSEIRELTGDINGAGLTDDDAVPEVPKKAKSTVGDLYVLGDHRLLCGDATMNTDLNKLMDKSKADLIFTDPPYNIAYEARSNGQSIQNDDMTASDFHRFLRDAFGSFMAASKEGASAYVWHSFNFQGEFWRALIDNGFEIRSQIVWAKNVFSMGARYRSQHELCFYAHRKGEAGPWYGDKSQSTIWEENKPSANRLHPTMKPVELVMRAVGNSSKAGDVVLDLFGGSGSTLIACEKMKRRAFLMEIDPKYCDVIVQRWEEFTGKKASLSVEKKTTAKK